MAADSAWIWRVALSALGSAEALEEELRTSARKGNPKDQWLLVLLSRLVVQRT